MKLIQHFPFLWSGIVFLFGLRMREGIKNTQDYSNKTAMERIHDPLRQGRGDFMGSMLRTQGTKDELSEQELGANANILFMAGSETSSTALAGITYWLLKTPSALRKVTEEVRASFTDSSEMTFTTVMERCPYLMACIQEGLRIYPSVPGLLPRIPTKETVVNGITIPPGSEVLILQVAMYWSNRNFSRAREFHPERWLPEATSDPKSEFYNDNREVYQPFSVGPRNCIGRALALAEMKLILSRVLWSFDMELVDHEMNWPEQRIFFLWSKRPLMVRLRASEKHKSS